MSFDIRLKAIKRGLTNSEQRVAEYISKNIKQVPYQSIYEVAEGAKISVGTVTRLVKKIGYASYKDFRIEMAQYSSPDINQELEEFTKNDSDAELIKKIFTANINMINDTRALVSVGQLSALAKTIIKSKKVSFFGIGGSGLVAQDAAIRFNFIDINSNAYFDPIAMLVNAQRMNNQSIAIGISHSGETKDTVRAIEIAKNRGATTVSITNHMNCNLNNFCKYKFSTGFSESQVRTAALTSRVAQYCIIDILYFLVVKNLDYKIDYKSVTSIIEEHIRI